MKKHEIVICVFVATCTFMILWGIFGIRKDLHSIEHTMYQINMYENLTGGATNGIIRENIGVSDADATRFGGIVDCVSHIDQLPRESSKETREIDQVGEGNVDGSGDQQQRYQQNVSHLTGYFGYEPTDAELDLFYRVVMAECGNTEPDDGVAAVADVIANRCISDRFPSTLSGVLNQQYQFETVSTGRIYNYTVTERVRSICDAQIERGRTHDGILFFTAGGYNPYCVPAYTIGNHYFGY